jgi:hypothetical protein
VLRQVLGVSAIRVVLISPSPTGQDPRVERSSNHGGSDVKPRSGRESLAMTGYQAVLLFFHLLLFRDTETDQLVSKPDAAANLK